MKWMSWAAFALICASCAAPQPPTDWTVERIAPDGGDSNDVAIVICDDMRTLALGSHADSSRLTNTLDELARISAVVGATAALPALNRARAALDRGAEPADVHDDLVSAAERIDAPSVEFCDLPMFTAVYAASGWPSCHGELAIPVAGYTLVDPERGCSSVGSPSFLPCWSDVAPFLPISCYTGDVVQVIDGGWQPAGDPHEVRAGTR